MDKVFDPGEANYTGPETTIPWNVAGPVGYSDYASIGQYWITGTRAAASSSLISIAPLDSVKTEGIVRTHTVHVPSLASRQRCFDDSSQLRGAKR